MESEVGKSVENIKSGVLVVDSGFTFLQMVRLLLKDPKAKLKALPGYRGPFSEEKILFRANPSLAFQHNDVSSIKNHPESESGLPTIELTTNFMGLYGPASPLPVHITEDIIFSDDEDASVRHFLDIFNHRMISFLYRALEKYKYSAKYRTGQCDDYTEKLFSFAGIQQESFRHGSVIDWERLIPFVALLGQKIRSAWVLETILRSYFCVNNVKVIEFVETTVMIQDDSTNSLGAINSSLGIDLTVGRRVSDRSSKLCIQIGPLKYSIYRQFLPNGKFNKELFELVRFILNEPLDIDLELILSSLDVPPIVLTKAKIFQLGLNAWIGKPNSEQYTIRI